MPLNALGLAAALSAVPKRPVSAGTVYELKEITALEISRDGKMLAELWTANDALLGGMKLVHPEKLQATHGAGGTIEAWLYPPADFDPEKTYPMILYIHGGPQEYDGEDFDTGLENQLLPAKGWRCYASTIAAGRPTAGS